MLNKIGYDVEIAHEFDALYEVEQFHPDIVIVNNNLKKGNRDNLIDLIKVINSKIKCMISTNQKMSANDYSVQQVDGVIKTPLSVQTLKSTLGDIDDTHSKNSIRKCPVCEKDLSEFDPHISYCPYCGEPLHSDKDHYKIY